jgi:hypothetical protein
MRRVWPVGAPGVSKLSMHRRVKNTNFCEKLTDKDNDNLRKTLDDIHIEYVQFCETGEGVSAAEFYELSR